MSELHVLLVGGGSVAEEKLHFLFKSSLNARVTLVAPEISSAIRRMTDEFDIRLVVSEFKPEHLVGTSIVICATNKQEVNQEVHRLCKERDVLVNVADCPEYCDFYMGGIVTKGNIKLAISTNGKSPTLAKRIRQFLEDSIPDNVDELALNLNKIRKGISGDFSRKVKELNQITKKLIE